MAGDPRAALRELTSKVMGRPGVSGTAIGERGGKPCLKVYVDGSGPPPKIPGSVSGFPVVVEKTGGFKRL
jgi:hypothetical protein